MRLQIAALPPKTVGAITHADHIIVLDQVGDDEILRDVDVVELKESTGALAVLCSTSSIDVANPVALPTDVVEQLIAAITEYGNPPTTDLAATTEQLAIFLQQQDAVEFGYTRDGVRHPTWEQIGPDGHEQYVKDAAPIIREMLRLGWAPTGSALIPEIDYAFTSDQDVTDEGSTT